MWHEIGKEIPWSRREQWIEHGEKDIFSPSSRSQKLIHNGLVNWSFLLPKTVCSQHHPVDFTSCSSRWSWHVEWGSGDVVVEGILSCLLQEEIVFFIFLINNCSSAVWDLYCKGLNCPHLRFYFLFRWWRIDVRKRYIKCKFSMMWWANSIRNSPFIQVKSWELRTNISRGNRPCHITFFGSDVQFSQKFYRYRKSKQWCAEKKLSG